MTITRKNITRLTGMILVILAIFMASGMMAKAQAAEYRSFDGRANTPATTVNNVQIKLTTSYVNSSTNGSGTKYTYSFKTADKTVKVNKYDYYSGKTGSILGNAVTNGSTVYYVVTVTDYTTYKSKSKIYKLNLSTGKSTLIKSFDTMLGGQILGVYKTKIYYIDGKSLLEITDSDSGTLKCYDTSTKKTTSLYKYACATNWHNNRYAHFYTVDSEGKATSYMLDTHTGKASVMSGNPYEYICVGSVDDGYIVSKESTLYKMSFNHSTITKIADVPGINNFARVYAGYVYSASYNYPDPNKYYRTSIKSGTTYEITEEKYKSVVGY